MDKKKKRDLVLIGTVLVVAFVLYMVNLLLFSKPGATVEVSVDGEAVASYDLNKNIETTIHSKNGGSNYLVIKDGEVSVTEASCPDSICVHQGKIHKNGEMIVCLPNQMIAKIQGGED